MLTFFPKVGKEYLLDVDGQIEGNIPVVGEVGAESGLRSCGIKHEDWP